MWQYDHSNIVDIVNCGSGNVRGGTFKNLMKHEHYFNRNIFNFKLKHAFSTAIWL